ncbi:MAG: AAA family ATPase, partial [Sulfolobaceae archaeon]|nr:AAA family ATPase [Sulfolobales archaeon]
MVASNVSSQAPQAAPEATALSVMLTLLPYLLWIAAFLFMVYMATRMQVGLGINRKQDRKVYL